MLSLIAIIQEVSDKVKIIIERVLVDFYHYFIYPQSLNTTILHNK